MAICHKDIPKQEPVRPIRSQASCAWCEKDEIYVPMQDCVDCQYNHIGSKDIYCRWDPKERPACEGCGIPAEYCEPETCLIAQAKEKAAGNTETANDENMIIIV
jgi:hypothetical protein